MLSVRINWAAIGHEEAVAVEVGEHPLVRIEAVAIGQLEAVEEVAELGADGRPCRPGPRRRAARGPARGRCGRFPGSGSIAVEDVVPTVAATKQGCVRRPCRPRSASASSPGRMARFCVDVDLAEVVRCPARRRGRPFRSTSGSGSRRRPRGPRRTPSRLLCPAVARSRAARIARARPTRRCPGSRRRRSSPT